MTSYVNTRDNNTLSGIGFRDGDDLTTANGSKWVFQNEQWYPVVFGGAPAVQTLTVRQNSAQGVVIYGPDGKIIMGTHAQGVVNVPQTGTAGAELLLASCTIPGGCLGPNGTLRVAAWLGVDVSNANLKTITIKYGGVVIGQNNNALTSARTARFECEAYGDNSEAAILALQTVGTTIAMQPASTGSGTVPASVAVDTTVDQLLEIYVNLAVTTDVARVRRWAVDTRRGA
jgi:hypothetical protein